MNIKLPRLTCKHCGHNWTPRRAQIYECPKCKSAKWNVPKEK